MMPASQPRDDRDATRLLVVDPEHRRRRDAQISDLPRYLRAGDLLILNDAATLPGSLPARTSRGEPIEVRLAGPAEHETFWGVLFGAGDYHTRTEERPAPPELAPNEELAIGEHLHARIIEVSPVSTRLVRLAFDRTASALWSALYVHGTPVQYAYQRERLALWTVQTAYASRPWAAEMPSAGRPLSWRTLRALAQQSVELATLTHAAGLSATGDPRLDAALPLPERYEIPESTVQAIARTHARAGRVIAVGTTVVRALEGAAANGGGQLRAGSGVTSLRLCPTSQLRVVHGILTGMHSPAESHFELLAAFAPEVQLRAAFEHAEHRGYLAHEFGDASLILRDSLAATDRVAA